MLLDYGGLFMSKFVIIPDSTSDMTSELRKRCNVPEIVAGSIVFPDGHSEFVSCDWENIPQDEFYELIKNKKNVFSTGAPSPEQFMEVFEKYLKEGYDVLSISISSALSGTYQFALSAANQLNEKYPERKVLCIDSQRYSTAELLLIMYAAKMQEENKSIQETYDELEKLKYCLHQSGPMDDLKFLASKGRISNAKAFMGTVIGINPIGEIARNGLTQILCKVKGSKKALQTCLEYMKRTIVNPHEQIIVIAHSNRKEKAFMYKEMIEKEIQPKEVLMTEIGLSCAPNIGPGLCAAYYYGTEITDDLSKEQAIINDIIGKNK